MTVINGCPFLSQSVWHAEEPHCSMAMSAEHRSNLQPFTGNGDVFIWVKHSRLGRKNPKKHIITHLAYLESNFFYLFSGAFWLNKGLSKTFTNLKKTLNLQQKIKRAPQMQAIIGSNQSLVFSDIQKYRS